MNERPIPPAALRDPDSVEMLRVWVAEQKLHCTLKIGMYREMQIQEEVAWGTILADAARHIARALSEDGEDSESILLGKIRIQFNAELDAPSSVATGGFVES
jgi:hypothetical protein